ncbi:probable deacetylase [Phialocephala subalpina]|uniref:Probable deacetylase n=1 Tax=Phialocephala subalpina TaxID=576137 RepID=A0A1L7XUA6_9HELO|nr:probable deacetylase [Phialocephala subalpina]
MKFLSAGLLALSWVSAARAACSSNLLIDNYSNYANNLNSLGQWTSDDGTTIGLKADTVNKKITFTSQASSYFYTTFACEKATTDGYNALTFPIKGPAGASFTIELQTSSSCSTTAYTSYYTTLTGVTGSTQTYTVLLSSFAGANLNAIQSILFESFSVNGAWEIGQTQLVCAAGGSSVGSTKTSSTSTTSVATTSKVSTTLSTSTKSASSTSKSSTVVGTSSTSKSSTSSKTSSTTSGVKVVTSTTSSSTTAGTCTPLLVDDFASQSRLTFLFYNAMLQPSSDDGTMKAVANRVDTSTSVIVANNHVTLTPANSASYWYTMFGCLKATNVYSGVGMTISAPAGTKMTIELQTEADCGTSNPVLIDLQSTDLGWTFDGTERYYQIPFSKYAGLDTDHLISVLFSGISKPVTFGPIAFYCGTGSAYPVPSTAAVIEPSSTIPATTGPSAIVIDTFGNSASNNLGFWHGGDDTTTYSISNKKLTINMKGNSDLSWYTQISDSCVDFTINDNSYIHIAYTGSNAFTVALQQNNPTCDSNLNPSPYTWDSVEASRYSNTAKTDLYIPLTHFNINRTLSIGFALKGFYTTTSTVISLIEIVKTPPTGFLVPSKLPTAPLIFACTRPNSFAFAIDDGDPALAQQVVSTVKAAGIHVTFFTVGAALLDTSTNLTNVYKGMLAAGHQVAYHSYTHPPMEGLPSLAAIDWELNNDINAVQSTLGISSQYFRPPFGTEGARIRQRLAALVPGAKFVEWSVDVQDWLWALSSTPQNQVTNFQSDVDKGGNLVVMHYLYQTTVDYLPQFISIAKATGKQLMRVDQCLEDPNAPPL